MRLGPTVEQALDDDVGRVPEELGAEDREHDPTERRGRARRRFAPTPAASATPSRRSVRPLFSERCRGIPNAPIRPMGPDGRGYVGRPLHPGFGLLGSSVAGGSVSMLMPRPVRRSADATISA